MTDFDLAPRPVTRDRAARSAQLSALFQAAAEASAAGKAIRIRARDYRDRDAIATALAHRARTQGMKCHIQSGSNNTMLIWIDKP